jgi:hypothetical protein
MKKYFSFILIFMLIISALVMPVAASNYVNGREFTDEIAGVTFTIPAGWKYRVSMKDSEQFNSETHYFQPIVQDSDTSLVFYVNVKANDMQANINDSSELDMNNLSTLAAFMIDGVNSSRNELEIVNYNNNEYIIVDVPKISQNQMFDGSPEMYLACIVHIEDNILHSFCAASTSQTEPYEILERFAKNTTYLNSPSENTTDTEINSEVNLENGSELSNDNHFDAIDPDDFENEKSNSASSNTSLDDHSDTTSEVSSGVIMASLIGIIIRLMILPAAFVAIIVTIVFVVRKKKNNSN